MGVKVVAAGDIVKHIEGLIHEPTQASGRQVDLTVNQLFKQETPGQLDFGGSELTEGRRSEIDVAKDEPEDRYGWWILDEGTYLLAYNETIKVPSGSIAMICPHARALANGVEHPTVMMVENDTMPIIPLRVAERGARIKQNARISRLLLID